MASIIELTAARYVLGIVPSEELKRAADQALDAGIDSPSLCELAGIIHSTMSEAGPLFEAALRELSVQAPSKEEAIWIVLSHWLTEISKGRLDPIDGMARVMSEVYHPAKLYERTKNFVGDSHDLQSLIGNYYAVDDGDIARIAANGLHDEAELLKETRMNMVRQAKEWLAKHGV